MGTASTQQDQLQLSQCSVETKIIFGDNIEGIFKMKYFAVLLLLCTLLGATLAALKNPACGETFGVIGRCRAMQPKWTYRHDTNECINFQFGGCDGNNNLFDSKNHCETTCKI